MRPRQLNLLTGKPDRIPAVSEFAMQCTIADALRRWAKPTWLWQHIPGGEERPAEFIDGKRVSFAGARIKRAGFNPGWPDFMLIAPMGKLHCLELKRRGGQLSTEQAAFGVWCMTNGVPFTIARSGGEAFDTLTQWGVWRAEVKLQ